MERFGEKLRALRIQRELTVRELAVVLGYAASSHSYISEIETGRRVPKVEFVLKAARFFQVTTDQLVRDDLEMFKTESDGQSTRYAPTIKIEMVHNLRPQRAFLDANILAQVVSGSEKGHSVMKILRDARFEIVTFSKCIYELYSIVKGTTKDQEQKDIFTAFAEIDAAITRENIHLCHYFQVYASEWYKRIGFSYEQDLSKDSLLPNEDFEIIMAALFLEAMVFITEDDKGLIWRGGLSLGLNLPQLTFCCPERLQEAIDDDFKSRSYQQT